MKFIKDLYIIFFLLSLLFISISCEKDFSVAPIQVNKNISGKLVDFQTNDPLGNALVTVITYDSVTVSTRSNNNGEFEVNVPVLPEKQAYQIKVSLANYLDYNITANCNCEELYIGLIKMTKINVNVFSISGRVTESNASTGISGATIIITGSLNKTITTDNDGNYSITNLPEGEYQLNVSKSGYISDSKTLNLKANVTNYNFVLSKILSAGQYRIILQWGSTPDDLDGHLTGPVGDGTRFHMYYRYSTDYVNAEWYIANPWPDLVTLDKDDVLGNGYETITLNKFFGDGLYTYSVHDYSNKDETYSTALSNSNAQVSIYQGNSLLKRFDVPTGNAGNLWKVFEIRDGVINTLNEFSYENTPGDITLQCRKFKNKI